MRKTLSTMTMKKILFAMIVISMAITFAACGSQESKVENSTATETNEETIATETAATEPADADMADIGEAQVKQIVLDRIPGATETDITEFSREIDNGILEYEGEVRYNGYEYEFEIDGSNGDVLSWGKEIQD